jgi:hypothetical protein
MRRGALSLVVVVSVVVAAGALKRDYPIDSIAQGEGTRLRGSATGDRVGISVGGGGGDVDGDGVADFVVGACEAKSLSGDGVTSAGQVYVLYGLTNTNDTAAGASAWPTDTTLLSITQNSTRGRIIDGTVMGTKLGRDAAIVGDVNGDRYDDIAVSANDWNSNQGKVWLVWGKKRTEATNPLFVDNLIVDKFVELKGVLQDPNNFGQAVAGGDFNHDGISDLLIGAHGQLGNAGRSYIVWGHNGTWPDTISAADISGSVGGVVINGDQADSRTGISVANAGDVNRDGKIDLIIGAYMTDYGYSDAGRAYIVFGKDSGTWQTEIDLGSLGSDGVIINGAAANDQLGWSVSGNVDVNGDNTADVIVGAYFADPDLMRVNAGITYVVFGSATLPSVIDADSTFFDGTKGFKLFGEAANDYSG